MAETTSIVLLDTNIIPLKGPLRTLLFESLEVICNAHNFALVIPEIVMHESVNRRRVEAEKYITALFDGHRNLSRLWTLDPLYLPSEDDVAADWEQDLSDYFKIYPPHATDAVEALNREALRTPPARQGKGGRDALIWLTALRLGEEKTVHLVTKNSADFGQDGELFQSLETEAIERKASIEYHPSLESFIASVSTAVATPEFDEDHADTLDNPILARVFDELVKDGSEGIDPDYVLLSSVHYSRLETHLAYIAGNRGYLRVSGMTSLLNDESHETVAVASFSAWVSFDPESKEFGDAEVTSLELWGE